MSCACACGVTALKRYYYYFIIFFYFFSSFSWKRERCVCTPYIPTLHGSEKYTTLWEKCCFCCNVVVVCTVQRSTWPVRREGGDASACAPVVYIYRNTRWLNVTQTHAYTHTQNNNTQWWRLRIHMTFPRKCFPLTTTIIISKRWIQWR